MKILIFTPNKSIKGGVSNFYSIAEKYFTKDIKCISFNSIGYKGVLKPFINIVNFLIAIIKILYYNPITVVVNPSLGKTAILRDGILIFWCKILNKKTIVFWRGWNQDNEIILQNGFIKSLFEKTFKKVDKHIVLNKYLEDFLIEVGVSASKVERSTTLVDDSYFNQSAKLKDEIFSILFLSRIEKYKGIYEALEAYKIISENRNVEFIIAGIGNEIEKIKKKIDREKIKGVKILGFIDGEKKREVFQLSDCYLFPSYSEGMPNSVLEAMASGLPIISRPVGGLVDFFEEDKMGYLIESLDPKEYAEKIIHLLENKEKIKEIGKYNHEYAKDNFLASKVTTKLEFILKK